MNDPTANTLLLAAQDGDRAAFEALRAYLLPSVQRFIRRLIGVHSEEDDILQHVFIALYVNLEKLVPSEKLLPFIYRVARNRCYDVLRQQQRWQTVSYDEFDQFVEDRSFVRPEERVHWKLVLEQVAKALDTLPEPQRVAFILFYEESLSCAEIAEVMNSSIGTIKSRLYHARLTLSRILRVDLELIFGKPESK